MNSIYLDYAAATPLDPQVLEAMRPYFSDDFYNPSATYLAGRAVRKNLDQARHEIAQILGSRPGEIIFTSGATEANNLAIGGVDAKPGQILISAIEHDSVLVPARARGAKLIPVSRSGIVDLSWLEKNLAGAVLISIIYVSNELGVIQPMADIAKLISIERQKRLAANDHRPLYFHSDATQAPNFLSLAVSRLGVDLMSINGGKIYGPKQTGLLYVKSGTKLTPQLLGGGQEGGLRSGTENVPGVIGLAKALSLAQTQKAKQVKQIGQMRQLLKDEIIKIFPEALFNGSKKHSAPHILSVTLAGYDNERLMMELDEKGVQVAVGSACNASSDEPSQVLAAVGLSKSDIRSTLRFSLGKYLTEVDIRQTAKILKAVLHK